MAKRSPHFHNVPTVSIKSNYIVDGNLDLNGVLKLTGKLVINGEEVIPGSGGSVSITAGEGIKVEGSKVSIDKGYIDAVVENSLKDTNTSIENLSQRIENIEQNGSSNKVLEEKIETLENTLKDLETNIEGFVSKEELSEAVEELSNRIDTLAHFTVRVESELPEILIENSIYLIPSDDTENSYIEYIAYKNSDGEIVAELIGSTKIDLSDYVTKDQIANLVTTSTLEETVSTINTQLETLIQATEECKARKHHVIVDELPPKEEADDRLLYLVRNYRTTEDVYDEFVFNTSTNKFERVGIDASLYTKKSEFDALSKDLTGYKISTDDYLTDIDIRLSNLEKNSGTSTPGTGGSSCDCGDRLTTCENRLNTVENEISDLWNNKVSKTEFDELKKDVEDLKNNGTGGSGEGSDSCDCDLTQIESDIETLKSNVSDLTSSLDNKVSSEQLTSVVATTKIELEAKINTLGTSIDTEIESIKGRLSALEESNPESPEAPSLDDYVKGEELEEILNKYAKKETVSSLTSRVGVNETKINNLIARVTALEENSSVAPPDSGDEEPEEKPETSGFEYGKSYNSLGELIDDISNLEEGKIYSVTDKNTIEEYILNNGEVVQVSGGFNMQVSGDIEDTTAVSPMRDKIENGEIMYNMPELVNGDFLFKGCDNLKIFVSDTPSLTTARQMFYNCVNLETFCGVLSLLEDGTDMFVGCKLDEESILNIVDSINDFGQDGETRIITIGYNPESIIDGSIEDYTEEFSQKGWTVEWDARS